MSLISMRPSIGGRNYVIDLMRFVAASAVVMYHYTFNTPDPDSGLAYDFMYMDLVFRYGYLGVDLFFIISGLVIFNSTRSATFSGFWYGRFSRLYPAYWFCLSLTGAALFFAGDTIGRALDSIQYAFNFTMLQKMAGIRDIDPVYWTLAYELVFYFWVSLALVFGRRDLILKILFALTLLAAIGCFFPLPDILQKIFITDKIAYFCAGALIASIHAEALTLRRLLQLALTLVVALLYGQELAGEMSNDYSTYISVPIVSVLIFCIFTIIFMSGYVNVTARARRIFVVLGVMTYPLYLIHNVCGSIFSRLMQDSIHGIWNLIATMLVAYLAAYLIARHVEEPAMVFLRRLWRPARA